MLEELRALLAAAETKVPAKSPMAAAIRCTLRQWAAWTLFTTDGLLELDNNAAERALLAFAVGRKNWMFIQAVEGGRRAAVLLSVIMMAKAIALNAITSLRDVLPRISQETDPGKLPPRGCARHYAEHGTQGRSDAVSRLLGSDQD